MGAAVPEVIARAKQLIAERNHQEAVRACRRVLLARPNEHEVRLLLAQALLALDRHDEVRLEMLSLIRKAPQVGAAHRLLGEARMRLGRTDGAREALRAALKLDPADDEARDLLEEMGEAPEDLPPEMGTIDRWFAGEETDGGLDPLEGEATMATASLPDPFEDSTTDDPRVHTGASIELAPELGGAAPLPPPPAAPSAASAAPAPSAPRAPAPSAPRVPAPSAPRAPAPSIPRPPQAGPPGASAPRAAAPKPRRKATLLGMAAGGIPGLPAAPAPSAPSVPRAPLRPAGTAELSDDDLAPVTGEAALRPDGTAELDVDDLAPALTPAGLGASATGELDDGDLEELPAEATARAPGPDAPDFGDETTRGAKPGTRTPAELMVPAPSAPVGRGFADEATSDGTTEARPRVDGFDFPSDEIDTGLPPLEGEATLAREAPQPDSFAPPRPAPLPAGFTPAPMPGGAPRSLNVAATPMPVPSRAIPTERPPAPDAADLIPAPATPAVAPAKPAGPGLGERLGAWWAPTKEKLGARWAPMKSKLEARAGRSIPTPVWIALAGIPVLLLVVVIAGLASIFGGGEEEALIAARQAADDGLVATLDAALALEADEELDSPEAKARQGWLMAIAALEHGRPTAADAEARLASVGADIEPAGAAMATIARAYLALEQGDATAAATLTESLNPDVLGGEGAYARAQIALARGEHEAALDEARKAQSTRPNAARYAALLAQAMALLGESEPALQLTSGVAGAEASPVVRLARIRAHAANDDWDASLAEAEAVFGPLADRASERQEAWARLGAARALAGKGEDARAREMLAGALEARPPACEAFGLEVAEVFLDIGSPQDARTFVDALPATVADAHRRAAVSAEVYLAQDDLDELERVLGAAADSPRTAFLRGRLAEAREELDDAKRYYEAASADEGSRVEAKVRLGAIALQEDEVDDAIEFLAAAVEAAPQNVEAVALLARAHLADGEEDDAAEVLRAPLEAQPNDPTLLLARADVELADDRPEAAMRTLESLVEQRPNDADLHASLGEAARRIGNLDRADQAFAKALELRPGDKGALQGKVLVAIERGDAEAAQAAVEAAEAGGVTGRRLDVAKARLLVLQGRGQRAEQALRRFVGRRTRDASLLNAYGWAQAQAEDYRDAKRSFERALRADDGLLEAHLGMALVEPRLGDLRGASQSVGAAERIVRARSLGPRAEARVAVARGRVRFEYGSFGDAREHADEAVEKDPESAEGHFLLAMIADATGDDPEPHLRRAAAGRMPAPEVLGQLVIHMGPRAEDKCELGRRYLAGAPRGIDAPDVRRAIRRCR
ncbi:MAG: hypothetical protein CMN30_03870 [Sandaracinus sp.]|nr:hypothetical protein [Sandaracinus sp.]